MTDILRCVRCSRRGRAFAFLYLPACASTAGVSQHMCPACRVLGTVVDEDGQPAAGTTPVPAPSVLAEAQRVAQRAVGRPPGRQRHGGEL